MLKDLFGGPQIYDKWENQYDVYGYGNQEVTDTNFPTNEDRYTLAYLRHSNDTVTGTDLKYWNYYEPWDCGYENKILVKVNGKYKRECQDGPPMYANHWLTMRNAIDESLTIGSLLSRNGTGYKGTLVNAFYPKELDDAAEVVLKGEDWRRTWGEGRKFTNYDSLKDTYAQGVLNYFNRNMSDFDGTTLGFSSLTASSYANDLFDRFSVMRHDYFDKATSFDQLMDMKEKSCAVGDNLTNKKNILTPEDYFTLRKLKGLLNQTEGEKVPHAGVIHRELISKLRNSKKAKETLGEFFSEHSAVTMMEIFINMHFSVLAKNYESSGTSRILSNTGRWKNPEKRLI